MNQVSFQFSNFMNRWLPFSVAGIGIITCIIWYALIQESSYQVIATKPLSWVIWTIELISLPFLVIIVAMLLILLFQRIKLLQLNQPNPAEAVPQTHAIENNQKIEKSLLQAQKLQAIGTLAGGIAHDFNNIIYAIIGYTEMAREDVSPDSTTHANLGKVLEAAHHGQELISRILTFSRHQHHDFTPLSLQETIESILSLLKPTIPSSISIQFSPLKDPCMIKGDLTELHQSIVNIINNAVDAMEGEGVITIKITTINKQDKGNYYKIEICDTGSGMSQATLERVFEPFFTTKEVGKGTGLGLSTVHTIITDHQGEITVSSQLGHGTTFVILLPEYKEE